jgi:hypothetical protein
VMTSATTTGAIPAPNAGLTMPRRTRTRAQDRARRIDDERNLNQMRPPTEWDHRRTPAPF